MFAVSLIGLPASGKTSLAYKILKLSKMNMLNASVIVISFDEFIKLDFSSINDGDYKKERDALMTRIEMLMKKIHTENHLNTSELSPESYHIKSNCVTLVILDDNFYYQSMRQKVRALCRSIGCDYFQIYMESSLDSCIERNNTRQNSVPQSIILKMFHNFEIPTNSRTIFIRNPNDENLITALKDRMENPEKLIENMEETPEKHQSFVHEIDLMTRKEIGVRIKSMKGLNKAETSLICAGLNEKRKKFMDDLRAKKITNTDVVQSREAFNLYLDEIK